MVMKMRGSLLLLLVCFYVVSPAFGFLVGSGGKVGYQRMISALKDTVPSLEESFPVLSKIQGINWTGECRYTDAQLQPASFLLTGGTRYDLDGRLGLCTLTSFLAFPDGKSRQVQMKGRRGSLDRPSMRLDPTMENGPIYMVITELPPDTILINEVSRETGKIVLTASLSIVNGGEELVQVAHEVGDGDMPIEGHQVWRLKKKSDEPDDDTSVLESTVET